MHFNRQLEQIIQTLRLRLRLRDILTPNVNTMPLNQYRTSLRPLLDSRLQTLFQILLVRSVLNNRDLHRVKVSQISQLPSAFCDFHASSSSARDSLDLLDLVHGEDVFVSLLSALAQKSDEHRPLRVRVNAAAGVARGESC
jgi:hypothetical protein